MCISSQRIHLFHYWYRATVGLFAEAMTHLYSILLHFLHFTPTHMDKTGMKLHQSSVKTEAYMQTSLRDHKEASKCTKTSGQTK